MTTTCRCGAELPGRNRVDGALVCGRCGLTHGQDAGAGAAFARPVPAALAEKARQRPEDPRAPGRFSLGSIITAGLGVTFTPIGIGLVKFSGAEGQIYGMLLIYVMGVAAIAGILKLLLDLRQISPFDRTTPERAVKAYLGALDNQRWGAAWCCLSWTAKEGQRAHRPAFEEVSLPAATVAMTRAGALSEYWLPLRGAAVGLRGWSFSVGSARELGADLAQVPVDFTLAVTESDVSVGRVARFAVEWPVYRRDGLWYLLAGELPT